ncbi:MAG: glycosyltransferase family 2 protein [Bacteroidota bacterium]
MNPSIQHTVKVSVIIPCRNEESFIAALIENILVQDYPTDLLEVFFIDGKSEDRTVEVIKKYITENSHLRLLFNPQMFVPFGLNKAIQMCQGEVIIRMDAHSIYPKNYISELVFQLADLNADNVGGAWNIKPANQSPMAKAIAFSNRHPFGIGNAQYRYAQNTARLVDTVPFGCYPKRIFEEIGLFDEELIRNQDDEFNARLKKRGGKIFLIPSIKIDYFARPTFRLMSKMFYQYGLYKPLVNKKLGRISTLRQLFPALLILGTILGIIISIIWPILIVLLIFAWALYLGISMVIAISQFKREGASRTSALIPISFIIIHFSYGWGYLEGLLLLLLGKRPRIKSHSR